MHGRRKSGGADHLHDQGVVPASLGGVEFLEHRKTVEAVEGTPDDLLRLSVGLEHADDLYRDLSEALWDAHGRIASSAKRRKTRDARKESEENGG